MSDNITLGDKLLFPSEYVGAIDLKGRDVTLTIDRVEIADLRMQGGAAKAKPIIYFIGAKKKFVMNKTNARVIAALHGGKVEGWAGKKIVLYPTTTRCGGSTVDCVRVREYDPDKPRQEAHEVGDGEDAFAGAEADAEGSAV